MTLGLILCLSVFSMDVNLPVFSLIAADLGATPAEAQLIVTLFLLGYAAGQIPVGLVSDRYGRLPVLYVGTVMFLVSSVINAIVNDFDLLLIGRLIQGLSASAGAVVGRAVVRDISEGKRLSQLMAVLVSFLSVVSFCAPLIGSFLIVFWSWRSTFWVTAGLNVLLLILIKRNIGETHVPEENDHSALQQLKTSLRIFFSSPQCIWGTLLVAIPFSGYMILISSASTILIEVYGIAPSWIGFIFSFAIFSYLAGATLTRFLVVHWGIWSILKTSIVLFIISTIFLLSLSVIGKPSLVVLWSAFAIYLLGVGFIFPTGTAVVLQAVPKTAHPCWEQLKWASRHLPPILLPCCIRTPP